MKDLFNHTLVDTVVSVRDNKHPDTWAGKLTKHPTDDSKIWMSVPKSSAGSGKGKTMRLDFDINTVWRITDREIVLG